MRSTAILNLWIIVALLQFSGGAANAQPSCGLPLPCKNTAQSTDIALSIINNDVGSAGAFTIHNEASQNAALIGRTNSLADRAYGVVGRVGSTAAGDQSAGVVGKNFGTNPNGLPLLLMGVLGTSDSSSGVGVLGQSNAGVGVRGSSSVGIGMFAETTDPAGGIGVWGKSNTRAVVGTQGDTSCGGTYGVGGCATTGNGMFGRADTGIGVWGNSNARGVVGTQGSTSCGGTYGVGGCATTGNGMFGRADTGIGVWGNSNARGLVGTLGATSCAGSYAVGGCAVDGDGVVGRSDNGRAGFFIGNVQITGTLTKGGGAFKIDHPLEPENKYLYHSFVESSDMLSIYSGNAVLDEHGEATVVMPNWFSALNRDFRYQLTAIGAPGPNIHIAEPIKNDRFKIGGGQSNMTISWQVTGVRHDAYAESNRIPVEEDKPEGEKGKYLHPLAYGKPQEMGVYNGKEPNVSVASLNGRQMEATVGPGSDH